MSSFRLLQVFLKIKVIFFFLCRKWLEGSISRSLWQVSIFSSYSDAKFIGREKMTWNTWTDYSFQWETFLELLKTLMHLKMLWTHLQHGIINVWNVYKYVVPRGLDFYVPSHFLFPTSIHSVLVNRQEVCLSRARRKKVGRSHPKASAAKQMW